MENIRCVVMDLSLRVSKAQQNVLTIKNLMQSWKDKPLFQRTDDGKGENLLNFAGITIVIITLNLAHFSLSHMLRHA